MRATTRLVAAAACGVAALGVPAVTAGPALAAEGHIVQISSTGGEVHVVLSPTGLADGVAIDPASVQITIDGRHVSSTAQTADTSVERITRTAVLVIDTSGSMQGAGIHGAKAAALAFVDAVPADVEVGLVTFSNRPTVAVAPTTDRGRLRSAVSALAANGETALYDGVATAVRALGTSGARTMVVLSDGGDTTSRLGLHDTLAQLRQAKPIVDAVAFNTSEAQSGILRQFTQVTGGQLINASGTSDLAKAFQQAAHDVSGDIVVTATAPADLAEQQATVTVTASAGGETLSDSASVYLTAAPQSAASPDYGAAPAPVPSGVLHTKRAFYGALIAIFAALCILLGIAFTTVSRDRSLNRFRRRLSVYTLTGRKPQKHRETTVLGDNAVAQSAVEWAGRVVTSGGFDSRLAQRLEAAGVPMKPAEWLLVHVGTAIAGGFVFMVGSGGRLLGTALGLVLGVIAPWLYLSVKRSRRTAAFLAAMPDTLQLMAGSLVAGYSLAQAVDAVVREGSEPVAGEFNRALVETRLGMPMEDALAGVAQRMGSKDFEWVVMAIRIQREVGGNLAELLTTVSATLRERERLRRQVRVLSAEGRLSAYILFGLPILFAIYLFFVRPQYLRLLYTDPLGWAMLILLVVLLTIGGLWLRKVVRVEV